MIRVWVVEKVVVFKGELKGFPGVLERFTNNYGGEVVSVYLTSQWLSTQTELNVDIIGHMGATDMITL